MERLRTRDELVAALESARARVSELEKSEAQFRSLAESTQDYIMRYDPEGRHLYMNPAALDVAGMSSEDIIGKTHREAGFAEELSELWETKIRAACQTGLPSQTTFEWEGIDGVIYLDWRLYPEFGADGKVQSVLGISRDVTESKRAEERLRSSKERFCTLFENLPTPLWEEDFSEVLDYLEELNFRDIADFEEFLKQHPEVVVACLERVKILGVNKAAVEFHGAATAEELLGNLKKTFTKSSLEAFEQELVAIWRGDHYFEAETELCSLDREPTPVALSWRVPIDHEDNLERVMVAITDISQFKRAENLEADQRKVLELISSGQADQSAILEAIVLIAEKYEPEVRGSILLLDGDQIRPCASPNLPEAYTARLDGLTIGPSVGSCGTSMYRGQRVITEDVRTCPLWADYREVGELYGFRACWSQPIQDSNGATLGSFALYRKQPGSPSREEISLIESMANLAGITIERNRKEAELKKLSVAVEQSPASVMITDPQGKIEYVNASFCRLSEFSPEEVIGRKPEILRSVETPTRVLEEIWTTVLSGREWKGELMDKKKNGDLYWMKGSIFPALGDDGEITHLLAVGEDVTVRKALEAEKLELERIIRRSQKLETLGTLAGGIAHDFNNILTPIMGYAEIARNRTNPEDPLRSDLGQILSAALRAKELVERILLFSRQSEKDRRPVSVQLIAAEAIQLMRSSIPATISIDEEIDSSCECIMADETQIHEVVINLLTNSFQAMEKGSGTITIGVEQVAIDSGLARPHPNLRAANYVRISIRDTGIGIDSETIERIFEPFFTTKEIGKGSGMGLSVVHGIVKDHGGEIFVYSEPGEGALFEVYLPTMAKKSQFPPEGTGVLEGGDESILIVDDDPSVARIVATMVESLGYRVATYTDSLQALEELLQHPQRYNLVLSDLTMPGLTGIDLANRLGQCSSPIPILIMTGHGDKIEKAEVTIPPVIAKPVVIWRLAGAIRELLDKQTVE